MTRGAGFRRGLAAFALFDVLAGDLFRYLVGYTGWVVVLAVLLALVIVQLVRMRQRLRLVPGSFVAYLVVVVASIGWSHYRGWTALGITGTLAAAAAGVFLGLGLTRADLLHALSTALKWAIGLSLLFELVVAVFVRAPVLPFVAPPGADESGPVPKAYYWSQSALFTGDRIQGIVGNANLLAMLGLLGLIVFSITLVRGPNPSRVRAVAWIAAAVLVLALTRSATALAAALAVAIAFGLLLLLRRLGGSARAGVYFVGAVVIGLGAVLVAGRPELVYRVLGRADDTHRSEIWEAVVRLAQQHPVLGWGWVSYWVPWIPPFDEKVFVINHVQYLQAHDAWLDLWLQLGILGVVVFGFFALVTLVRAWWQATDRPRIDLRTFAPFDPAVLLAPLVLVALLVQSVTESRLLIESGFVLLVAFAVQARRFRPGRPGGAATDDLVEPAVLRA